jgi:hypothetical protein
MAMLTNFDSLPIERIHQMLRIFAMQVKKVWIFSASDIFAFRCSFPGYFHLWSSSIIFWHIGDGISKIDKSSRTKKIPYKHIIRISIEDP